MTDVIPLIPEAPATFADDAADVFDAHLSGAFPDAFFRSDNGYLMDGHIDDFE